MYNIALDLEDGSNLCIDLPPELGNNISRSVTSQWPGIKRNRLKLLLALDGRSNLYIELPTKNMIIYERN